MNVAQHFIDLALPAHNPDIPKPRGLIPIPPEVAAQVSEEEARLERDHGIRITADAKKRMLDHWTLSWYYDNAYIAYRCTSEGIEVLAVGQDEVRQYVKDHPPESRRDVIIDTVW